MQPTLALPPRLTIEAVESLHTQASALAPGVIDGAAVTVIDGAGAQWLASAVLSGWSVQPRSQPLEQGVALLGLSHLFPHPG